MGETLNFEVAGASTAHRKVKIFRGLFLLFLISDSVLSFVFDLNSFKYNPQFFCSL